MKLPRDVSGVHLVHALTKVGYTVTRQKSSHIRLTTHRNGEHHVTVPDHGTLKVGTLAGIVADVAAHLGVDRMDLIRELFE